MTARKYANYDNTLPPYDKNNLGDMIIGIKAALITGYKEVKPAGWELLYESASNTADSSKRIVVRSKSVDSEQKVFEIEDISNIEGSIKCWDNWSGDAGVNLLMQARINKNCWGVSLEIVASDKFVHLVVNAVYMGFGDVDLFNTNKSKTLLYDMQSTENYDYIHAIASTVNQNRVQFRDSSNNRFVLRSFCRDQLGYGARISWQNPPIYDIYNSGDRGDYIANIETPIRKTEILKIVGNYYECFGYLPQMVYTDNPQTMTAKTTIIDNTNKVLREINIDGCALTLFAVDV